jgi:hypothetical protein
MTKGLIKIFSLLLIPALAAGVAFAAETTPETTGEATAAAQGEHETVSTPSSLLQWASFLPFVRSPEPVEAPRAQPAAVAPSASALARLSDSPEAAPLETSSPRRASSFLFEVPGIDAVEVSPN